MRITIDDLIGCYDDEYDGDDDHDNDQNSDGDGNGDKQKREICSIFLLRMTPVKHQSVVVIIL